MNLGSEVFESIDDMFDCEAGHMGYYKDEDELIKV